MHFFLDQYQNKQKREKLLEKKSGEMGSHSIGSTVVSRKISASNEHLDENKYIPIGLEIPVSQLAKVKEGHDLVIRLRDSEILGVSEISGSDKLDEKKLTGSDGGTTVIRVKKISTVENPQGTSSVEIFHTRKISRETPPSPKLTESVIARVKKLSSGNKRPDAAQLIVPEKHFFVGGNDNPAFNEEDEDDLSKSEGSGEEEQKKSRRSGVVNFEAKLFNKVKKISNGQEPNISELLHHRVLKDENHENMNNLNINNKYEAEGDKVQPSTDDSVRKRSRQVQFNEEGWKKGGDETVIIETKEKLEFEPSEQSSSKMPQVLAALGASLGAFAFGTVLAWSSTATADLKRSDEFGEVHLDNNQISWISSIAILGAVAACPIAGYGMGKFGRKKVMMYLTGPFILGWILIALARDVWQIYLGRFITGLCGGCFSIAVPIFTSETSDSEIRGGLGTFFDILMSGGMLYIYVIGQYTSWRLQAAVCAIIPIAFHCFMFFIPESPRYLIEKEKVGKAEKAMYWLKGVSTAPALVKWEMSEISKSVCELKETKFTIRDTFRRPTVKPTLLMLGVMFFTTLSGFDVVVAYTVIIFQSAGSGLDPGLSTIIIGVVSLFASFPSALFVDKAGRKILLMISGLAMTFSLSALGFFFYVKNEGVSFTTAADLSWLPLTALIAFIISFSAGFGPLHIMLIGEILPNHLKGLTSCLVLMARWAMAFLLTNTFAALNNGLGEHGTFWLFAIICLLSVPYIYFFIPETKGKTIDEIQIYFVKA